MTRDERKYFASQVGQIFSMMTDHSSIIVCGIKQLDDNSINHDIKFTKLTHSNIVYHRVYRNSEFLRLEYYEFHPNSIKKFNACKYIFDPAKWKLFDRWSKMDIGDMIRKIDLKLVEML